MAKVLTNPVKLLILFRPSDKILRLSKHGSDKKALYDNIVNIYSC